MLAALRGLLMEALAVAAPLALVALACLLWELVARSGSDPWDDLHR
jgi:hypothetical protein